MPERSKSSANQPAGLLGAHGIHLGTVDCEDA